jgi:hypothetical protein
MGRLLFVVVVVRGSSEEDAFVAVASTCCVAPDTDIAAVSPSVPRNISDDSFGFSVQTLI